MHLKLPVNSFLGIGECKRGNVWINSEFTSFTDTCVVEFSKILDVCETLKLALSLSFVESNFGRSFFSSTVVCSSSL